MSSSRQRRPSKPEAFTKRLSLASELLLEQVAAARREERAKAAMALGASLAALKKSGKATKSHEAASSAANAMTETRRKWSFGPFLKMQIRAV